MTKTLFLALFSWLLFSGAVIAKQDPHPAHHQSAQYLFVQTAMQAKLQPIAHQEDSYQLILLDVNPYLKYFTDRPNRVSGVVPLKHFLAQWHKSFAKNPPNADLYGLKGEHPVNISVELTQPHYDEKNHQLVFKVRLLKNEKALSGPITLKHAAIFIDDFFILNFCASCVGINF